VYLYSAPLADLSSHTLSILFLAVPSTFLSLLPPPIFVLFGFSFEFLVSYDPQKIYKGYTATSEYY
jgi:hypothetical protein